MSEKILIRNADAIVTCDDADRVLYHSDILLSDGRIEAVGCGLSAGGAQVIDAAGKYVYPGLVNTHHHGDHTFGNALFSGATIVAHERTREEAIAFGPAQSVTYRPTSPVSVRMLTKMSLEPLACALSLS